MDWSAMIPKEAEEIKTIPEELASYIWKGAATQLFVLPFGKILLNSFAGKGYVISACYFLVDNKGKLERKSKLPCIELCIPFHRELQVRREWSQPATLKENQFNIFYQPEIMEEIVFDTSGIYSVFWLIMENGFLEKLSFQSLALEEFWQQVKTGKRAQLLKKPTYLDPQMITIINDMLRHRFPPSLVSSYWEVKVQELMMLLINRINYLNKEVHLFSQADIQKAEEVKKIIMSDFEKFHTLKQLAHLVGTNEQKLKTTFHHLFGTTVFNYSRQARLEYARQLLLETNWTLQHIAMAIGYPEASNFSASFKQYFGYAPGYFKKAC